MKPTASTESAALYKKNGKSAFPVDIEAARGLCLLSGYISFSSRKIYDSSL